MGQALELCVGCDHPRSCDTCVDLHEWIMEHLDAVPVVRCKECIWGDGELICVNPKCTKSFYGCPVSPENFCSYGERKEGAE